jgi:competence protein ComEC
VSLAAQAATLPVILMDFGRLSLVSPIVNVLVAPFVAPAMAAGSVALVAGLGAGAGLPGFLATIGGLPAWLLLGVIVGVVRAGAALPFASLTLDPPANLIAAALAALAVGAARYRVARRSRADGAGEPPPAARQAATAAAPPAKSTSARRTPSGMRIRRGRQITVVLVGSAVLAIALVLIHRPDGTTRITVLDVGQGDAILVEGSRGGRMLVDGGPDPSRLMVVLDERLPPWDRRLDAVVLTHPHEDHVAGLALLLQRYHVGRVFEPGMIGPGPGYAAWNSELTSTRAPAPSRWALGTGDRLSVDDIDLQVLWPDPASVPLHPADGGTAINNVSIVLLGTVEGHRFLLAGDIEEEIDPTLLARGLPTLDFLKVAHHGSKTSSTQAFLDAVRPRVAVVSAGAGNPYGHPAPATIARLHTVAQQVYRTDLDGSVTVTFDGPAVRVHASGGRSRAVARPQPAFATSGSGPQALATPAAVLFSCAIPTLPAGPVPIATTAAKRTWTSPTQLPALPHPIAVGAGETLLYHRPDDGSLPGGGCPPAALPRPTPVAPAAFARRGRGRCVAGAPHRGVVTRATTRPRAGRDGRAPPRHRQGAPEGGAAGRSARRGRCRMAQRPRPP